MLNQCSESLESLRERRRRAHSASEPAGVCRDQVWPESATQDSLPGYTSTEDQQNAELRAQVDVILFAQSQGPPHSELRLDEKENIAPSQRDVIIPSSIQDTEDSQDGVCNPSSFPPTKHPGKADGPPLPGHRGGSADLAAEASAASDTSMDDDLVPDSQEPAGLAQGENHTDAGEDGWHSNGLLGSMMHAPSDLGPV
mmetsp:Transcript_32446/g.91944  ORF Transcript_32446/g.91944 Transcript_32446/m.91944 type:complete len:198 (+) Transcript_32446:1220-1813(+)